MQKKYLQGHHLNSENHNICCSWSISEKAIQISFYLKSQSEFNCNPKFSKDYKENWGLWEHDVFEVFIKKEGKSYLELQVSPLGQPFALIIDEPRVLFHPPQSLETKIDIDLSQGFSAHFEIPFTDIPGDGNKLYGNCFSCLGDDKRSFYALNINKEAGPDFHRPDLFIEFGELS